LKDNFSSQSGNYAKYRPEYPARIYELIRENITSLNRVWDCGTGNGQVAVELSEFFKKVEATDISSNQIKNAIKKENIHYSTQPAEKTGFPGNYFDLIISAQAVHWFNFNKFYREVNRCLKPDGLLVLMGYGLFRSNTQTNIIIDNFYRNIIGSFWDEERKYLDEAYESIPFPFKKIKTPDFIHSYTWNIDHLLGYLRTWSAVKHYVQSEGEDPVALIENNLRRSFGNQNEVNFPILLKMGKL